MTPPSESRHAVLMLQPQCNMTCSFCVTDNSMGRFSMEEAEALLTYLKSHGFVSTIFGGGEPFYWPHDLHHLVKKAKDMGFITQIGTNATRVPKDFAEWDFVDRWVLPVDGVSDEVHNRMRLFQSRHREIIHDRLIDLRNHQRSVTISTVITKVNLSEIQAISEYLRELQSENNFIHAWHLYKFLPQGRGGQHNQKELELPAEVYEQTVNQIKSLNLPFKVFKRKDMLLSKTVEFFWREDSKLYSQTGATGKRELNL